MNIGELKVLTVLGKSGKKMDLVAMTWAVDHLLDVFELAFCAFGRARPSSEMSEDLEYR